MEKRNLKLKNKFTQLIGQVSKMYKEVSTSNDESYLTGRKETLEEILNWFVSSHNGELKYVSATSFFNMIQEKLSKTKSALVIKSGEEAEEDSKSTIYFAEIKISDNRKRINKYASVQDTNSFCNYSTQNELNMVVENPSPNLNGGISSAVTGSNTQITFPISIGSLTTASSDNNILLNNNNVYLDSIRNTNINTGNQINSNITSAQTSGTDVFCQNLSNTNISLINSISEYSQNHGNIFGSSNIQPGLFLPNRKRKSFNK